MKAQSYFGKRYAFLFGERFSALRNTHRRISSFHNRYDRPSETTDPSFAGQIVTMTFPLIGNYGINLEDMRGKAH